MNSMTRVLGRFICCAVVISSGWVWAQQDVLLDFNTSWQAQLQALAVDAGVMPFSEAEQTQIETMIHDAFLTAWQGFDLNIVTLDPGGFRDRVDFGATTSNADQLGSTVLDFGNTSIGTARVYSANFDWFIEPDDTRDEQITELATSLAGTAIHELAHGYGARHAHAYGTPTINPSNYADTGGAQNQHLLATGPTGINELERETPRTLSEWTKVVMEVAQHVTAVPITLQSESGDAGDDALMAQPLPLAYRNVSDTNAGYVQARLDEETDFDWFSFSVATPSRITVELWSDELFSLIEDFDGQLRLVAPDGSSTLASGQSINFDGDAFGPGTTRRSDDVFLVNVPLSQPGTYYLEVSSLGSSGFQAFGDYRLLLAAVPVPEPVIVAWWTAIVALLLFRRPGDH